MFNDPEFSLKAADFGNVATDSAVSEEGTPADAPVG